jgi:prepilin-type N-terminal cleavage/methylation domain-containing protein/prepilin-type processing-associated H-X9-DG protein
MKSERAFTLTELLVAMALIGILAALLLTPLRFAKEKAKATHCLNNLKQWGTAAQLFAVEHRDYLPQDGFANPTKSEHFVSGWYIQLPETLGLPPYAEMPWRTNAQADVGKSIWICPSNPRRSNGNNLFHYCLNGLINGTDSTKPAIRLSALSRPSAIVYLFDNKNIPAVHANPNSPGSYVHTNLHNGGAQMNFVDGHAARFRNRDYWDFKIHKARTNNPDIVWVP